MTVTEFLKKDNIDVTTNKSPLGNQLKADLSNQDVHIDFDKKFEELTDEEKYQIGRSIIPMTKKGEHVSYEEIITKMNNFIEEDLQKNKTKNLK
jgi:hypothetical protein